MVVGLVVGLVPKLMTDTLCRQHVCASVCGNKCCFCVMQMSALAKRVQSATNGAKDRYIYRYGIVHRGAYALMKR